jgi:hypothetical protein
MVHYTTLPPFFQAAKGLLKKSQYSLFGDFPLNARARAAREESVRKISREKTVQAPPEYPDRRHLKYPEY